MVVPDPTPPSVAITAPANGASVTGTVTIAADASDNIGVAGVQFVVDGANLGAEDTTAPYSVLWTAVGSGTHNVYAIARDTAGNNTVSSTIGVTVVDPNDPALVGQWSARMNWPLVAVHMTQLHTGEILMWDGWELPGAAAKVWNPSTNAFTNVPVGAGVFCAAQALLTDGRPVVIGGHAGGEIGIPHTFIFETLSKTWTRVADLNFDRWYPSATRLGDGRVVAFSGQITPGVWADTPEIYNPLTNQWTLLTGVNSGNMHDTEYPLAYLLPDGTIYVISPMLAQANVLNVGNQTWINRGAAPLNGSGSMYRPGRILMTGGGGANGPTQPNAAVIDATVPNAQWRTIAPMIHGRYQHNLVVLADGNVLAVGGANNVSVSATEGVLAAELWNANTETWSTMASMRDLRMYHSTALLLPDGRVLVAGGGRLGAIPSYPTAEIFSPPYLFRGARPTITQAPATGILGEIISIDTPDAADISRVALVPLAAVTHTSNMNQTYVELAFTRGTNTLSATLPTNMNVVAPGYYMLFILNGNGVPAVAPFIRVLAPADPTPPVVSITSPAAGAEQTGTVTVTANATDAMGVTSVQFLLDGQPLGSPDTTAPYAIAWDTTLATNGSHNLSAIARDTSFNEGTAPNVPVTVANVVTAKTLGYTTIGDVIDTGYPGSIHTWRFQMPNETGAVSSMSVYVAGPVSAAPNNQFQMAVYTDSGGVPGTLVASTGIGTITPDAWNTLPVTATLQPNATYWLAYNTNGAAPSSNSVRIATGSAGQMRWRTQAFGSFPATFGASGGGVAYQGSIYVTYTNGAATPRLMFLTPAEGGSVTAGNVDVTYQVTGSNADVDHVHYQLDSGVVQMEGPPLDGLFTLPDVAAGTHTITGALVRADHTPIAGSDATPRQFTATATPTPRLDFLTPAQGASIASTAVNVTYQVTGSTTGVDHVHYQLDGGAVLMEGPPMDGAFTLAGVPAGSHTLTGVLVRADHTAIAGSDATPRQFSTTVPDTTAPTVGITFPAANATVIGTITVTADAADNVGVTSVQFRLDGQPLGSPDTTAPYSTQWSTTSNLNGTHTLTAVATDAAGNTTTSSAVGVTVSNGTGTTKTLGYTAVGATVDSDASGHINTWRFVMPNETGAASSVSVFIAGPIDSSPNNQFQVAIYTDAGGVPGTRVASSASQAIVANAWNTVSLTATLQPNATYWIAYNTNGRSGTLNNIRIDPGSTGQMRWRTQAFGTWPTPFGTSGGGVAYRASIYITYTVQ
jgi:hypothetical protein